MDRSTKLQHEHSERSSDSGYLSENLSVASQTISSSNVSTTLPTVGSHTVPQVSGDSGINLEDNRPPPGSWKDVYEQDENGDTRLHRLLATDDPLLHDALIDILRMTPHPDLLDIKNNWGQTALHVACEHEDVVATRNLICAGAVANRADSMRYTPFHIAAHKGNVQLLRAIIRPVTDDEIADLGLTLYGVTSCPPRAKYPELSSMCSRGMSPLHLAVASGNIELLEELLPLTPSFSMREMLEGRTVLQLAIDYARADMVRALLEHSAAVHAIDDKDYAGRTALDRAQELRQLTSQDDHLRRQEVDEMFLTLRLHGASSGGDLDEDGDDEEHIHDTDDEEDAEGQSHEENLAYRDVLPRTGHTVACN